MALPFDRLLPRLVAAYERGRLVPFLGSGMSMPVAKSWKGLITGLEAAAGIAPSTQDADQRPEALVRRANKATRKLRLADAEHFHSVVRALMGDPRASIPPQTLALARTWWPLVLSTNYDNLFAVAHRRQHGNRDGDGRPIQVLGRCPIDCQHVLSSLSSPSHALLWALQGFLKAPNRSRHAHPDQERPHEVVIGHQEYRAVANRELHFRRAFAEVFRNRSLLFLGSGLSESYLLDLFGEVLEMYGPSTRPNYALMRRGEVDPEFMLARFHTEVCEYDDHAELPGMLDSLADAIAARSYGQDRWSWRIDPPTAAAAADFTIVRGAPRLPGAGECLIVSGGERNGQVFFGEEVEAVLRPIGVRSGIRPKLVSRPLTELRAEPLVFAALAVEPTRTRDLRSVFDVCRVIFAELDERSVQRVVLQQVYSGQRARFPDWLALAQVVRAYGYWRRSRPESRFAVELRVWQPSILHELASGRLDVLELLVSEDIRFWVEIVEPGGTVERRLFHESPLFELAALFDRVELPLDGWTVEVVPSPSPSDVAQEAVSVQQLTLVELGVVPGSALVLRPVVR